MSKQKLTRKSYKRNIIVFGIMIFMGVALVSTGFATWVLSQDTTVENTGNVEVGIVADESLTFADVKVEQRDHTYANYDTEAFDAWVASNGAYNEEEKKVTGFDFMFEPLIGDGEGRVKYLTPVDENPDDEVAPVSLHEQMSIKISGKITSGYQHINSITVDLNNTAGTAYATAVTGLVAAANQNLITLPEGLFELGTDGKYTGQVTTFTLPQIEATETDKSGYYVSEGAMYFQIVIEFGWGTGFGGENPSTYYDKTEAGQGVGYNDLKAQLQNLRAQIHGTSYEDSLNNPADLQYAFTISFNTEAAESGE